MILQERQEQHCPQPCISPAAVVLSSFIPEGILTTLHWIFLKTKTLMQVLGYAGFEKIARSNGIRDLPLANELLRYYPCRTHLEPILKVRTSWHWY